MDKEIKKPPFPWRISKHPETIDIWWCHDFQGGTVNLWKKVLNAHYENNDHHMQYWKGCPMSSEAEMEMFLDHLASVYCIYARREIHMENIFRTALIASRKWPASQFISHLYDEMCRDEGVLEEEMVELPPRHDTMDAENGQKIVSALQSYWKHNITRKEMEDILYADEGAQAYAQDLEHHQYGIYLAWKWAYERYPKYSCLLSRIRRHDYDKWSLIPFAGYVLKFIYGTEIVEFEKKQNNSQTFSHNKLEEKNDEKFFFAEVVWIPYKSGKSILPLEIAFFDPQTSKTSVFYINPPTNSWLTFQDLSYAASLFNNKDRFSNFQQPSQMIDLPVEEYNLLRPAWIKKLKLFIKNNNFPAIKVRGKKQRWFFKKICGLRRVYLFKSLFLEKEEDFQIVNCKHTHNYSKMISFKPCAVLEVNTMAYNWKKNKDKQ